MITVKFFAVAREKVGISETEVPLEALTTPTVKGLMLHLKSAYPVLESLEPHIRIAVDQEFVTPDAALDSGSEVALIPPVSGGAGGLSSHDGRYAIGVEPLAVDEAAELVRRPSAGALITFEGTVRNRTDDHEVVHLDYEAYPEMALKKLVEVGEEAAERWAAKVAIHHRYGHLTVGETAVVIAVSTPHRADGYECSQWIIDRLKEEVPIWKKEVGPDGATWVGFGP